MLNQFFNNFLDHIICDNSGAKFEFIAPSLKTKISAANPVGFY